MRAAWYGVLAQAAVGFEPDPPPPPPPAIVYAVLDPDESNAETANLSTVSGFRFTVGDDPLTVRKLRLRMPQASGAELVQLWRVSDQAKIAEQSVTPPSGGAYAEVELNEAVTLNAATDYIVSHDRVGGGSRLIHRGGAPTFNPAIFFVDAVFGNAGTYPGSVSTAGIRTGADFGFDEVAT